MYVVCRKRTEGNKWYLKVHKKLHNIWRRRERESVSKDIRRYKAKKKKIWRGGKRCFISGGSTQAMSTCPSDKGIMRMMKLVWWVVKAWDRDGGILFLWIETEEGREVERIADE
jgi:hypothetical protein